MTPAIELDELEARFEQLSYPITREAVAEALGDQRVQLADGETTVGETLAGAGSERYVGPNDLIDEFLGSLPRNAVGEP